jgi:ADP-ribose pyrophosphatase YjhB (NUDIX family)
MLEIYKKRKIIIKYFPFVVVGCIIGKKNKILLVQEGQNEPGKWNQPAGWLEKYENPIKAAKRESEEETGQKVKITQFLGVYSLDRRGVKNWLSQKPSDRHALKLIFAAKLMKKSKIFRKTKEISQIKWFSLSEIKKLHRKGLLRDPDIICEAKDFFAQKGVNLNIIQHHKFVMK